MSCARRVEEVSAQVPPVITDVPLARLAPTLFAFKEVPVVGVEDAPHARRVTMGSRRRRRSWQRMNSMVRCANNEGQ